MATSRVRFVDKDTDRRDAESAKAKQPSARNRRRLSEKEIDAMAPQLRSKYMAYEQPPKEIAEKQKMTKKRILEKAKTERMRSQSPPAEEELERRQHEMLIGQLKAAEARNRIRITRLRYEADRGEEIGHLVASQPSAAMAVRLEALLPVRKEPFIMSDPLDKISRDRVERLMGDDLGILTGRT